jgi:hypothetical protein
MATECFCETFVYTYESTRRLTPEHHPCEILSSHGGEYGVQSCLLGYTAVDIY